MAGHSKWSNIKFRKKAQDNKRCKMFNKISNEITNAASLSSSLENNSKLKMVISKALSFNMPKKNIEKAIERGKINSQLQENYLEGFCSNGIAILILYEIKTNAKIKTEIQCIFEKNKCSLAKKGSCSHIFKKEYIIKLHLKDEERVKPLLSKLKVKEKKNRRFVLKRENYL